MLLQVKDLVAETTEGLIEKRKTLPERPGLALIWAGNDAQTKTYVQVKKQKAKLLDCDFYLHQLNDPSFDQLSALIHALNKKRSIHGIVLQLPLPHREQTDRLIQLIDPGKDIDNLRGDSKYPSPTPNSILKILEHHRIEPAERKTVILGAGRLVGSPLSRIFTAHNWPFLQIPKGARQRLDEIRQADLLIAGTGVKNLVGPEMVHPNMVAVDASGIDVDVPAIEPLVKAVTPSKGSVGPMTVCCLFENLLKAAS